MRCFPVKYLSAIGTVCASTPVAFVPLRCMDTKGRLQEWHRHLLALRQGVKGLVTLHLSRQALGQQVPQRERERENEIFLEEEGLLRWLSSKEQTSYCLGVCCLVLHAVLEECVWEERAALLPDRRATGSTGGIGWGQNATEVCYLLLPVGLHGRDRRIFAGALQ